jgi:hypothetical protein
MPKKKPKPHRAVLRNLNDEQKTVLTHFQKFAGPAVQHVHPQRGIDGEIQVIAFASGPEGDSLVRMDRIPPVFGQPFTLVLRKVFPEFPACLDLMWKSWTPEGYKPETDVKTA